MGAYPHQARLSLDPGKRVKQLAPSCLILPARVEVWQEPTRPFHREHLVQQQSRLTYLLAKFIRMVEVGGGEPVGPITRITVLTILEIALDDLRKGGIIEIAIPI
jgi:hypothetical protein